MCWATGRPTCSGSGASIAEVRGRSVSDEAIRYVLGPRAPCTIGLEAEGGDGVATLL
eukprot:SAG31_NODE_23_length_33717_cov_17.863585_8_plen_57_part_00